MSYAYHMIMNVVSSPSVDNLVTAADPLPAPTPATTKLEVDRDSEEEEESDGVVYIDEETDCSDEIDQDRLNALFDGMPVTWCNIL